MNVFCLVTDGQAFCEEDNLFGDNDSYTEKDLRRIEYTGASILYGLCLIHLPGPLGSWNWQAKFFIAQAVRYYHCSTR